MAKLFFFDLETTGTNFWQHGIHQIAGCVEIDGEVKEVFDFKVAPNPAAKVVQEALDVGGVTLEQVQAYPPMAQVYKQLTALLGKYVSKFDKKDKFFTVGFNNAAFDNQFLRAFFVQNGDQYFGSWFWSNPIDTFVLAGTKLMDVRSTMLDFKLKTVAKSMGIDVEESRLHEGGYDIELTRQIYQKCL